jgi:xylose isomerase
MGFDPGHFIQLALAALAALAWLLRLEAKTEANRTAIDAHEKALKVFVAKVADDAKFDRDSRDKFMASHQELRESMVRVETQLANLTQLVEHLPHEQVSRHRKPTP